MQTTHLNTNPILRDFPDDLTGPRVLLRPLRPGNGAAMFEAVAESREQLSPWLPWVEKTQSANDSEEAARGGAARWLTREDLMVGIWDKSTSRYLGESGLHRINPVRPRKRPLPCCPGAPRLCAGSAAAE